METLRTILLVLFVVDSLLLVLAILIQSGRGGGLAGALGGIGRADSAFGVRAASQIEKITGGLAAVFMAVAIALAFIPLSKSDVPEIEQRGREPAPSVLTEPPGAGTTSPPPAVAPTSPLARPEAGEE